MQESAARDDDSSNTSNRRGLLRGIATGTGAVGVAGLAGCVGSSNSSSVTTSVSRRVDADSTLLSKQEFDEYVAEMHDRYGDSGPWGTRGTEPDHELSYVGAWTVSTESQTTPPDTLPLDDLVAVYRIPEEESRGTLDYYQFWVWTAVEPSDGATVRRLRPKVKMIGDERQMRMYSPAAEVTNGPVSVGLSQPTVEGLNATVPLTSGTIRVDPEETRVGEAGAYTPVWSGETTSVQSVTATFEASWPSSSHRKFDWSVELRGETDSS